MMFSHYVLRNELFSSIVDGRESVAACGDTGELKAKDGEYSSDLPLCPVCEIIVDLA